MQIRKGLLGKRFGISAVVLLMLLAATVLAAVVFITIRVRIRYPVHENITIDVTVNAGEEWSQDVKANADLPRKYDFKWILGGDLDKFSQVRVDIYCDERYICTISENRPESEYYIIEEGGHIFLYQFYGVTRAELKEGSRTVEDTATLTISIDIRIPP